MMQQLPRQPLGDVNEVARRTSGCIDPSLRGSGGRRRRTYISSTSRSKTVTKIIFSLVLHVYLCCLSSGVWSLSSTPPATTKTIIQICQNKDCCRRYKGSMDLVQTMNILLPPPNSNESANSCIEIKSSSCLSHCDKGPNIVFKKLNGSKEIASNTINGVEDVTMAAVQLELETGQPPLPILLAAARLMDKTSKASTSPEEQIKFLNSVIDKLTATPNVAQSAAAAHAHAMRAKYWFEFGQDPVKAVEDAKQALSLSMSSSSPSTSTIQMAYRALTDAYEQQGNIQEAIQAYQQWATLDPSYRTKINKEIQRLLAKA